MHLSEKYYPEKKTKRVRLFGWQVGKISGWTDGWSERHTETQDYFVGGGRAFGVALRGVEQSKTSAYFGLECGVFTPIRSAIRSAIQNSGLFWIWSADCTPKVSECQMLWEEVKGYQNKLKVR